MSDLLHLCVIIVFMVTEALLKSCQREGPVVLDMFKHSVVIYFLKCVTIAMTTALLVL